VLMGLVFANASRADVLISELRGSGTAADDDYVELFNDGAAPVNVAGYSLDARAADGTAAGFVTLPARTIAPRGTLLVAAPGYSLGALASSDGSLVGELPHDGSIALFDSANALQDSVRFAAGSTFGEGGPLGTFAAGGQYAFVRRANRTGTGDGYGLPADSDDNHTDFALLVPEGGTSSAGSALPSVEGVPGPQDLSAPPLANAALQVGRLDPAVSVGSAPNRQVADPDDGGPLPQTLYLRRTVTNVSGAPLTRLQFRVSAITTARSDPQAGQAILRLDSSDNTTVAGRTMAPVALQRSLQTPLPSGGGLNAVAGVPSISPASPLAPGAAINVEFALRIAQAGAFQVVLNTEANGNRAPTDIALSADNVAENQPAGTAVGTFATSDPDAGDTHSYSLVVGAGDTDNAAFQIVGSTLQTNQSFDFEAKSSYTIRVRSTDNGAPVQSREEVFAISVTNVNDAPTDISLSNAGVNENEPAGTAVGVLAAADQDAGQSHAFALVAGAGDTDNGAFQIVGSTLQTNQSFDFEAKSSYTIRVRATDDGVPASSVEESLTITIADVNDPPNAVGDSSSTVGNTLLAFGGTASVPAGRAGQDVVSGDVVANDTDQDADTLSLDVAASSTTSANGGEVTWFADGSFRYAPPVGFTGEDTLTYSVTDGQVSRAGTVTITVINQVWYVHNAEPAGGDGRSNEPFDTLAEAEAASSTGDTVYVFDGDNTSVDLDTGYAMAANERLVGEHSGLSLDPDGGGPLGSATLHPGTPGAHPTLMASGEDVIVLATGSTIDGVNIDPGAGGGGIAGGAGTSGVTITDVNVFDSGTAGTQPGLELDGTTGTNRVSDLTVATTGATGVRLNNAGTVDFASAGTISITTAGARALDATATTNMGTSTFDAITVSGSGSGGVNMANTTGTTTFGDLSLITTSGSTAAFNLSNAGAVSVPSAGTANASATGGPAIDVTGTSGATLAFDDVSSSNSTTDGINLAGLGTGTFGATSGTIAGAAGIAFDLDGGSGTVSYGGALNNGAGQSVEITGRSGGAVTLSGPVADGADAGGGISLSANTGGFTTFSNASKTLNTGSSAAIAMASSDGHTLTVSGGGLDVDTTSGVGIGATNSGALSVTGTGNTITTSTGTALNVSNTDIGGGAAGTEFQSLASNGAASGIALNNTGSGARLHVTGSGGTCTSAATCTGGAIQNSTGAGVVMTSVGGGVDLTRMSVNSGGDDGIRATTVGSGLNVANSRVAGNGNAVSEHGLEYLNVTGSSTVSGSTITGSAENNARIENNVAGTNTLAVSGSTFSSNSTTIGSHGLELRGGSAATINANVTSSTFSANRDNAFQLATSAGSPTLNLHFNDNTVTGGNASMLSGQPGVVVAPSQGAQTKVEIDNNQVSGTIGRAIIVNPLPGSTSTAQFDATVTDNTVGNGTAFSGSAQGEGVIIRPAGDGDSRIAVRNNLIRNYAQIGLWVRAQEGSGGTGNADVTVTGNTLTAPSGSGFEGIFVSSGAASSDNIVLCADIGGAGALANTFDAAGTGGVDDLAFSKRFATDIRLPGFVTGGDLQAHIRSRNNGLPTVANYDLPLTGQAGACAGPTLPP